MVYFHKERERYEPIRRVPGLSRSVFSQAVPLSVQKGVNPFLIGKSDRADAFINPARTNCTQDRVRGSVDDLEYNWFEQGL